MSLITPKPAGSPTSEEPPDISRKLSRLSLNPNAQEFVPSCSKSSGGSSGVGNGAALAASKAANLDRTSSSNSNASDDEYRQFWRSQLPDDLISDADFAAEVYSDTNQFDQQQQGTREFDVSFRRGGLRNSSTTTSHRTERTNGSFSLHQDHNGAELEHPPDEVHPLTLLATEFPNFAVQSLSDIYFANGCDLSLTIEMLTQLELQEEGAPSRRQAVPAAAAAAPSLTPLDFPSLPGVELVNGLNARQESRRPMELATRRFDQGIDFAAVVRKQAAAAAHQPSHWPFERSVGDITIGPGRAAVQTVGAFGYAAGRATHQPWLETGDAVATMYSGMREEARDHARVRNVFFEQARQAYLAGNKALAKELSNKGQWYNEQMKVAHSKAADGIYHQRNSSLMQMARDGQRMIDLHGLHVSEAIPMLRRELSALRVASRATSKRQCVDICVGTGHHTKGSRTPARIPIAIERFLAEDERLAFTEVQPGMLRVFVQ